MTLRFLAIISRKQAGLPRTAPQVSADIAVLEPRNNSLLAHHSTVAWLPGDTPLGAPGNTTGVAPADTGSGELVSPPDHIAVVVHCYTESSEPAGILGEGQNG